MIWVLAQDDNFYLNLRGKNETGEQPELISPALNSLLAVFLQETEWGLEYPLCFSHILGRTNNAITVARREAQAMSWGVPVLIPS